MDAFLKETASDILKNYSDKQDKICIILPNKRARMFFRKYYAELTGQVQWAPDMKTINLLIKNFTKLNEPDTLSLIFDLYDVFKSVSKEVVYDFDNFYRLGEIILSDFNEIDSWLVDPALLFRNVVNVEEIENVFQWLSDEQKEVLQKYWLSFSPEKQSIEKEKFLRLWNVLPAVYTEFRKKLSETNSAYPGLVFRILDENIKKKELDISKYEKYIFIGFNALNKVEENLFWYLKQNGKAHFYWDTDVYYQSDKKQEAGDFLRKNFRNLEINPTDLPVNLTKNKKIQIIGVPLEVGQAKLIPTVLEQYQIPKSGNDTAIVLANEKMLFPVLHSLPEDIEHINITMGYPFSETPLYNLLKLYLDLQLDQAKNTSNGYNYKHVISILRQPDIWEKTKPEPASIIDKIEKENLFLIPASLLLEAKNDLLRLIFSPLPDENSKEILLNNLLKILSLLFDDSKDENGEPVKTVDNEYIHKAYIKIKRFREILNKRETVFSIRLTIDLLRQVLRNEQIAFAGEAVEGLQLMGVLETRNLDFKNVIILGMNEGYFPSVGSNISFISQSIRYVFGMPLNKFKDSVFAYLFYRLIQRAENITIVYNSITTGNTGELSRFAQQLKFESGLEISEKQFAFKQDLIPPSPEMIFINKDEKVMSLLQKFVLEDDYCKTRLSPSGINTYLSCSLQFYFRYIAGIKKANEIEEQVSPASFGTILHSALENLYTDYLKRSAKKDIEKEDFELFVPLVKSYTEQAFKKHYGKENDTKFKFEGEQIIVLEVLIKYIEIVLSMDKKYAPFSISSLENESFFVSEIEISNSRKIGIKGIIDRVDFKEGVYRIIDYKTGKADKEFSSFEDLFSPEKPVLKKNILQIFLYAWLFKQKNKKQETEVIPGIYDIRKMNEEKFSANIYQKYERGKSQEVNSKVFTQLLPEFIEGLTEVLNEMYDRTIPFIQTENKANCTWCDFKDICF